MLWHVIDQIERIMRLTTKLSQEESDFSTLNKGSTYIAKKLT
jgi:hypothetical protein